jgi:hypothetical protein
MKFTLIAEHETGEKLTYEFENDYLHNVLDQVDLFLRGAGFVPTGTLEYTEEEKAYVSSYDFSAMNNMGATVDGVQHSPHYFDTGRNR